MNKPDKIILHHSASAPTTTVQDINGWHLARNFPKSRLGFFVGYHYCITADGEIHQTRMHDEIGAHCIGQNRSSIGICVVGNFNNYEPTLAQVKAVKKLVGHIRQVYGNIPTYPHRHFRDTDCFGTLLDDDYFDKTHLLLSAIELLQKWKSFLSRR